MKTNYITTASLAMLLTAGSLVAQQPSPPTTLGTSNNAGQKGQSDPLMSKDQAFAKCLAISNQEQVEISRFAREKSTNDEVKAFAGTLEKAHQGCLDELKGISLKASRNRVAPGVTSAIEPKNAESIDFLQMHQEMSDQYLKDSKAMLSKKEGAEFDKCFVAMQVAKHAWMHSSLTVLQRHTSGDMQGVVKEGLAMNAEHLQASISLMEQLLDKSDSKADSISR